MAVLRFVLVVGIGATFAAHSSYPLPVALTVVLVDTIMPFRRSLLIAGITAVLAVPLYYPLPVVLIVAMPAIAGAIVGIPLVLPFSFIARTVQGGVVFAVSLMLLDVLVHALVPGDALFGAGFWLGLTGVVVILILLGQLLKSMWRGNADHLSPEAIAARYRSQLHGDADDGPTFAFAGHAHTPHAGDGGFSSSSSGDCGSSSCSSSSC
jgi:hypothetical protein